MSTTPSWKRVLIPIAVILVGAAGTLFAIRSLSPRSEHESHQADQPTQIDTDAVKVKTVDGKEVTLTTALKKVNLVNFWATWCEACVLEMPSIVRLHDAYKAQGFEVIAISLDDDTIDQIPRSAKEMKMTFPIFVDHDLNATDQFNFEAIPFTAVIDSKGKVLFTYSGGREWDSRESRAQVEEWLKTSP